MLRGVTTGDLKLAVISREYHREAGLHTVGSATSHICRSVLTSRNFTGSSLTGEPRDSIICLGAADS